MVALRSNKNLLSLFSTLWSHLETTCRFLVALRDDIAHAETTFAHSETTFETTFFGETTFETTFFGETTLVALGSNNVAYNY